MRRLVIIFRANGQATAVINFYIMTDSDYAHFNLCGAPPSSTYITVPMAQSYSISWVAPRTETEYFVFENYATGSQSSNDVTLIFTLYKTGTLQSYSTMYTTVSIPSVATNTVTLSSLYYSIPALPIPPITQAPTNNQNKQVPFFEVNTSWLLPLLVVAVAAIVTFILVANALPRIRSGTSEPKVTEPKPAISVSQSAEKTAGKLFCINCGAELPPKSQFCNKCGSAQA